MLKAPKPAKAGGIEAIEEIQPLDFKSRVKDEIRDGKTGKDVAKGLGIALTSLIGRLSRRGSSLRAIRREALKELSSEVERYLSDNPAAAPKESEEKWAKMKKGSASLCKRVFRLSVEGKKHDEISADCDCSSETVWRIRALVNREVESQMRKDALGVLAILQKHKLLTEPQLEAFRLVAAERMTEKEAAKNLDVTESAVSLRLSNAERDIPALARFTRNMHVSMESRKERLAKREKDAADMAHIDRYLAEHSPHRIRATIRNRVRRSKDKLAETKKILGGLKAATVEMDRTGFPKKHRNDALTAIAMRETFYNNPKKAVLGLKELIHEVSEDMRAEHIPKWYERDMIHNLTHARYVNDPAALRVRINEVKNKMTAIIIKLSKLDAPSECMGTVLRATMFKRKPVKQIQGDVERRVSDYTGLKEKMIKEGHPEIVAIYTGVTSINRKNPAEDWRDALNKNLSRHKSKMERTGTLKRIDIEEDKFRALVRQARSGGAKAAETLSEKMKILIPYSISPDIRADNTALLKIMIQGLPEKEFDGPTPLKDFATYASYAMTLNKIRHLRKANRDRNTEQLDNSKI